MPHDYHRRAYREVGVLQILGAADGHLQTTVEHLEPGSGNQEQG